MPEIRLGVIGCGSIAEIAHFPNIQANPETQMVAVCDTNESKARTAAQAWGASEVYTDHTRMLQHSELDAVVIASPPLFHWEQGMAAAEAGVHTLIEKPMTVTNMEAQDVVEAFRKTGKKLLVGCDRRYWLQSEWTKSLIDAGVIGHVHIGRSTMHEGWPLYQGKIAHTSFRLDPRLSGGAALADTGAHAIDLLVWLIGSPVRRVVGIAQRVATPATYSPCDDLALVMMEHTNGAYGYVSCNRFSPAASHFTECYGDKGTIFLGSDSINPYQTAPMAVYTDNDYNWEELPSVLRNYRWPQTFWAEDLVNRPVQKRWVPIIPPREPNNYQRLWRHFIDCMVNDSEPLTKGEDGAHAVEVMCAVHKSMSTGTWVELPLEEEISPPGYTSRRGSS